MTDVDSQLQAPVLLLAMPQVLDPFFHRSVVLLLHHEEEEGSFGFILNRPTAIRVAEILQGMEITWQGEEGQLAYFGGPVQPQLGSVLFALEDGTAPAGEATAEVAPGLALTQHVGDLEILATAPPPGFRLYLGYAGWGAGQLTEEILRNDWLLAPIDRALVFAHDPDDAWGRALRSVGVDPSTLPSWTAAGNGEHTN